MIVSLGIVFLVGLASAAITEKLKLPRIVGMLAAGMVCGPYVLNLLDPSILSISADLRKIALVIILIKAGLSLNLSDLRQVGRPAVLMSFLPAVFEIIGYAVLAPMLFQIDSAEALLLGSVLAAVSPAVVVPRMVQLIETGYGTEKSIPQMILAGASCDDIFVIVLFSAFLSMNKGGTFQVAQLL
ncbi:MAG: cation:proton antiporter, partial [Bulleidia sp.]|nr:cation:proton antiporter [Bulleidia sp.]